MEKYNISKHGLFNALDLLEVGSKIKIADEYQTSLWEKVSSTEYKQIQIKGNNKSTIYSVIDLIEEIETECSEEPMAGLLIKDKYNKHPIVAYKAGNIIFKKNEEIEDLKKKVAKRYMYEASSNLVKALNALEYGSVSANAIIPEDDPLTKDIEWFKYEQAGMSCEVGINTLLELLVERLHTKLNDSNNLELLKSLFDIGNEEEFTKYQMKNIKNFMEND